MNGATALEGQDQLDHPTNRVLAIFDTPAAAQQAVSALNSAGYAPGDIGLLAGAADARKLDAASGEQGPDAQIASGAAGLGDKEAGHVARYRQALLDGGAVIGVKVKGEEARAQVEPVLSDNGGHFINFYGRFTIQWLAR